MSSNSNRTFSLLIVFLTSVFVTDVNVAFSSSFGDEAAVKAVLASYNTATQKLDVNNTAGLFTVDSEIIESGGVEGTFSNYLAHHIGPELKEFKSFVFRDYKANVTIQGSFAFATESFRFRIEPKQGDAVERKAVATSVLKQADGAWKIFRYHWSSRKLESTPPAKP